MDQIIAPRAPLSVRELIGGHLLTPVFQPIVSLIDSEIVGQEALIRGPKGSLLEYPDALFRAGTGEGLLFELEVEAALAAIVAAGAMTHDHKIFLNISAAVLLRIVRQRGPETLLRWIASIGLSPRKVVLEITENERVSEIHQLTVVAATLRSAGILFAIDDFGDGRSSLRVWAELQPSFVKVDKFFTRDLAAHPYKVQMLKAVVHISETLGGRIIAEGIENAEELAIIRDLGISLGQGYFLAQPSATIEPGISEAAAVAIAQRRVASLQTAASHRTHVFSAEKLASAIPPVDVAATNDEVSLIFHANTRFHAIAVVEAGRPVGLINRRDFIDRYLQPFHKERFGKRSCTLFMDRTPILLDKAASIDDMVGILTSDDQRYLTEGFVITDAGQYLGLGTGEQLVRQVLEHRVEAARHANPLTFLPGNIPITMHIEKLIASNNRFVCCYCDLNHFKPYNDQYGYWRGDEVIRLLAKVTVSHAANFWDFVGHVGGDDFLILFQSEDWEERCGRILTEFNTGVREFFDPEDIARGGIEAEDRSGTMSFFPLTTLSIGAVVVEPGVFRHAEDVATAAAGAKRKAKRDYSGLWVITDPA